MENINTYNFTNKRVLLRVDFNVPLNDNNEITDDTRIKNSLLTINKIIDKGGIPIIMTHIGRPKGKIVEKLSVKNIIPHTEKLLNRKIVYLNQFGNENIKQKLSELKSGDVAMLENLRFTERETKGDETYAKELADLGDAFVMNAFGAVHRAHASVSVIAKFFPNDKMFGDLVVSELENVDKALKNPVRPFTAIMGGSKVSTKINIIESLLDKVDNLIIGGGIAYTMAKSQGGEIGDSIVENDFIETAKQIYKKAKEKGVKLFVPTDTIIADKFDNNANISHCDINKIPDGWLGLDIGIKSATQFAEVIKNSKTIIWNGPIGVFEMPNFSLGTLKIAHSVAEATKNGAFSLIGGGDSVAAVNQLGFDKQVSYISTAGGALLEYIEGKELPGLKAIME